jgi:membrane-bound lytic murein transglycosylase F
MNLFKKNDAATFIREVIVALLLICLVVCLGKHLLPGNPGYSDLDNILKKGEITMITHNNLHCFYTRDEQAFGFEYDLAQTFADNLGVKLKTRVASSWKEMITLLEKGKGDFIARHVAPPMNNLNATRLSDGYLSITHHIITHRNCSDIQNIQDLRGKTLHVVKDSACHQLLLNLQKQGLQYHIVAVKNQTTEKLLQQIAEQQNKVQITIANHHTVLWSRRYYPQLRIAGPIDETVTLKWGVHPYARKLHFRINSFFREAVKNKKLSQKYTWYYKDLQDFDYVDLMRYHRSLNSHLPRYKKIIEEAAKTYGFDWRLIAAQIYQESRFNPEAKSYAGALGLMQLTRSTAHSHNVRNILNPRQNIFAGVKQLHYLYNLYSDATGMDRLFLALGAYNTGQGHISDARRLAIQKQLDPDKWDSLRIILPLLQFPEYYKKARYGYCQGSQPVKYIEQIMMYYDILRFKTPACM